MDTNIKISSLDNLSIKDSKESKNNNIILKYLTNPMYLSEVKKTQQQYDEEKIKERKFYKKRIISLTKELFKNQNIELVSLRKAFEDYTDEIINYFKMLDTKDILQNEYLDLEHDDLNITDSSYNIEEANKNIMKTQKIGGTLDNFIVVNNTSPQEETLPIVKSINLKEESLKTKGVKKKKKS